MLKKKKMTKNLFIAVLDLFENQNYLTERLIAMERDLEWFPWINL